MQKIHSAVLMAYTLFAFQLAATDYKPWCGTQYSVDVRGSCLMQQFDKLDTRYGKIHRPEVDAFYDFAALMVVKQDVTLEFEVEASDTRYRAFGFDAVRLSGRYFILDDAVGDPLAVAAGVTLSKIFDPARRNIATFDHGGFACEAQVSVGKEISCQQFWTSRAWGVFGVGVADVGSPWLRANLVWERNWWERHQLKVFANTLWGLGNEHLTIHPFHGYGPVNYQVVDVGVRYGYRLCNDALVSLQYARRLYGRNCPIEANFVKLEVCYPTGF